MDEPGGLNRKHGTAKVADRPFTWIGLEKISNDRLPS